jgi:hypothetical protein
LHKTRLSTPVSWLPKHLHVFGVHG